MTASVCYHSGMSTSDEQAEYKAHLIAVHQHNQRMMTKAEIPTGGHSPRRGFTSATAYDMYYIVKIERHDRPFETVKGEEHYWTVYTAFSKDRDAEHCHIIGPRGRVRQAY